MSKRLKLAKKVLSKKGVIFISIDDTEQAQLKLLCDDIFGEKNFVSTIVWQKKYSPSNDADYFSDMHDFILVYARKRNHGKETDGWTRNLLPRTKKMDSRYKNPDNDPRGVWKTTDMLVKTFNKSYVFPVTTPTGRIVNPPHNKCWRVSKERYQELLKDDRIWFGKSGNNIPAIKKFLTEVNNGAVPVTWWDRYFAGHNQDAAQEYNSFNLQLPFETPKPVKLIRKILEIASCKNSLILDFMAGSGTTGHAVLELNKHDGGNRKFILCTNNEKNICTDICYPRIKKVIRGYKFIGKEKQVLFEKRLTVSDLPHYGEIYESIKQIKHDRRKEFDGFEIKLDNDSNIVLYGVKEIRGKKDGLGGNLRYFKTSFTDRASTDQNKKDIARQSTEMLCLKENCFEIVGEGKNFKIFRGYDDKYLGIIYRDEGVKPFKTRVSKLNKKITTYIFSLDDITDDYDFTGITNLIELKPIPSAILNAYRRICTNA